MAKKARKAAGRTPTKSRKTKKAIAVKSTKAPKKSAARKPAAKKATKKVGDTIVVKKAGHELTKDEILTLYLNLAPFGGNLEGVRAAALASTYPACDLRRWSIAAPAADWPPSFSQKSLRVSHVIRLPHH